VGNNIAGNCNFSSIVGNSKAVEINVYPNPFTSETNFNISIDSHGKGSLFIFDLLGKEIERFNLNLHNSGNVNIIWNGKDNSGSTVSPGFYTYSILLDGKPVYSGKLVKY